jgi:acyl carrier protein
MTTLDRVRDILLETISAQERTGLFTHETALWGALPEFDSMAVLEVITAIEEEFDIRLEDAEVSGEVFLTLGTLSDFVDGKIRDH